MRCFRVFGFFVWAILGLSVFQEAQSQTIVEVVVEGNERLPKEAVLQYVTSGAGKEISRGQIRDDLRALYNSGLFNDIRIDVQQVKGGAKIVVKVEEKAYLQEIRFAGYSEVSKEDLEKAVELKTPFLWDDSLIKASIERIRRLYRDKGFYLVTLRTEVLTEGRKKILLYQIDEGQKVQVRKIYFQGNKVFKDDVLKEVMITKEGGLWSVLSGSGRFDEDLLGQVDARRLQFHYWKYGYAFAKVDSPSVTFTPDRRGVIVSFHVEEGDQYDVGEVSFSGDLDFIPDPERLKKDLSNKRGSLWSYLKIQDDIQKIQDIYGDQGYAYTNVSPDWRVNSENSKQLDVEFRVDKGTIVYMGRVDVQGNFETHDRIVRRELEFKEGELFNVTRFRDSKRNLEKLGYFNTVKFVQTDILNENRMDLVIEVEERQTGTLTLGASFSSFDRFGMQGSVSKVNLFGLGYDISANAQISGKRQLFNMLFRNPRVFDSKYSLTLQAFNQEFQSVDETRIRERGGNVSLGYPLSKHWSISGTYGLQNIDINIRDVVRNLYPNSFGIDSALSLSVTRDTLNIREMFLPSAGSVNQLSTTVASQVLGSDLSYLKVGYTGKRYFQVIDEDSLVLPASVLSFGLRLDYLRSIEGRSTPFSERFVPGGIYSIRGHLFRSMGPSIDVPFSMTGRRDDDSELAVTETQKLRLGGNKQAIFNAEFLFDIFKEAKIKGVLFFDAGGTMPESDWDLQAIRYSTGFGFRWFSPLGPLRFEWGIPLDRKPGEEAILFDFSIGAPF
jgi:outer membrane protein insertion porin family